MLENINMSKFFLADPLVLTELSIQAKDYRIYQYLCHNYNVKKLTAFVRLVNIAGQFQLPMAEVQAALSRLAKIRIEGLPLLKITTNNKHIVFDMPRHKHFIKALGFEKYRSSLGWKMLREHTAPVINKKYLFPELDQHQLFDKLNDLPIEQLRKFKEEDFAYGWVLRNVKKHKQIS